MFSSIAIKRVVYSIIRLRGFSFISSVFISQNQLSYWQKLSWRCDSNKLSLQQRPMNFYSSTTLRSPSLISLIRAFSCYEIAFIKAGRFTIRDFIMLIDILGKSRMSLLAMAQGLRLCQSNLDFWTISQRSPRRLRILALPQQNQRQFYKLQYRLLLNIQESRVEQPIRQSSLQEYSTYVGLLTFKKSILDEIMLSLLWTGSGKTLSDQRLFSPGSWKLIISIMSRQAVQEIRQLYQFKVLSKEKGWGGSAYQVPAKYLDCASILRERNNSKQKKNLKLPLSKKKKEHYLNELMKVAKQLPGPGQYKFSLSTLKSSKKKLTKRPQPTSKAKSQKSKITSNIDYLSENNFLQKFAKKGSSMSRSTKDNYLDIVCQKAANSPGPGEYNPRGIIKKLKRNMDQTALMRKQEQKRRLESKSKSKSQPKDYNPIPINYYTFGKSLQSDVQIPKRNYMGSAKRFQSRAKSAKPGPGPATYKINNEWMGKSQGIRRIKSAAWFQKLSSRPERSIYY